MYMFFFINEDIKKYWIPGEQYDLNKLKKIKDELIQNYGYKNINYFEINYNEVDKLQEEYKNKGYEKSHYIDWKINTGIL